MDLRSFYSILKVFNIEFTWLETSKIKFLRFKQKPPARKFSLALKYQKVTEETLFSEKSRGPNFYGTGCEIQVLVNIDVKILLV